MGMNMEQSFFSCLKLHKGGMASTRRCIAMITHFRFDEFPGL